MQTRFSAQLVKALIIFFLLAGCNQPLLSPATPTPNEEFLRQEQAYRQWLTETPPTITPIPTTIDILQESGLVIVQDSVALKIEGRGYQEKPRYWLLASILETFSLIDP